VACLWYQEDGRGGETMKKRYIYLVTLKEVDYDQYYGFVVIADNKDDALVVCECDGTHPKPYDNRFKGNVESVWCVGNTKLKRQLVQSSFHAG